MVETWSGIYEHGTAPTTTPTRTSLQDYLCWIGVEWLRFVASFQQLCCCCCRCSHLCITERTNLLQFVESAISIAES